MVIINKGKTIVQGSVNDLLNAQELIVSFSVDNIEKAKSLLSNLPAKDVVIDKEDHHSLLLHVSQEKIPVINKLFCDNGVNVFSIEAKRKLEDYFLKLINA
jgi:ABC-2 type transport system ATP-binding protein